MNTTVAIILCAVLGFVVSALLGIVLVPWLHKLKFGQTILDIGPSWHKKKQGTPTMGGIMFIIATIAALLAVTLTDYFLGGHLVQGADLSGANANTKLWGGILMALGFAIIGFADDYIKVVKKRNLGLTEKQKTAAQLLVAVAYLASLHIANGTYMYIPFLGNIPLHPIVYYLFGIIVIYAATNAVNFTDGIDGLVRQRDDARRNFLCDHGRSAAGDGREHHGRGARRRMRRIPDLELVSGQGYDGRHRLYVPRRYGSGAGLFAGLPDYFGAGGHYICNRRRLRGYPAHLF